MSDEVKQPKYVLAIARLPSALLAEINRKSEEGYRLHTYVNEPDGDYAILSLKEEGKYEGVAEVANMPLEPGNDAQKAIVDKMLREGWTLDAAYAKHVTLLLKGENQK